MTDAEVVFENLHLHRIPLESAEYLNSRVLRISVDLSDEERATLVFSGVVGFRCEDNMMLELCHRDVKASRYDTLLRINHSPWLSELKNSYQLEGHRLSEETAHYVLCFDDYTWEILARACLVEHKETKA